MNLNTKLLLVIISLLAGITITIVIQKETDNAMPKSIQEVSKNEPKPPAYKAGDWNKNGLE